MNFSRAVKIITSVWKNKSWHIKAKLAPGASLEIQNKPNRTTVSEATDCRDWWVEGWMGHLHPQTEAAVWQCTRWKKSTVPPSESLGEKATSQETHNTFSWKGRRLVATCSFWALILLTRVAKMLWSLDATVELDQQGFGTARTLLSAWNSQGDRQYYREKLWIGQEALES